MKFIINQDYHIHSNLSYCSNDKNQTKENILKYAEQYGLSKICITDHFWDERAKEPIKWYSGQNFQHISSVLPLPQAENVKFYFGCETDMDKDFNIGISKDSFDKFDFVIIPTTHFHMMSGLNGKSEKIVEESAELYIKRLDALLSMDLPWKKIGIAHLTCTLLAPEWEQHLQILDLISDNEYKRLFAKIAELGAGFELNSPLHKYAEKDFQRLLRPYFIAKEMGCKFYLGSDAHSNSELEICYNENFPRFIELLGLEESDKFEFIKE